jgi:hypothetical protein
MRWPFGSKGNEITGVYRITHKEKFYHLYFSPNIMGMIKSRRMRWAGHVARMGVRRDAYRILMGKSEGKRPF